MLNSTRFQNLFTAIQGSLILALALVLTSCVDTPPASSVKSNQSNSSGNTGSTSSPSSNYSEPSFPFPGTFIQQGSVQTSTNLNLPKTFVDSFLIRGKSLSELLRKLPNTTKFCIVGKYNYIASQERFLLLSAKPKSFTDTINKTTEFYLQVEPSNYSANQNDCLVYNLTNELLSTSVSGSVHFSLDNLCTNCSSSVMSGGLKLFTVNGQEVPSLNLSALTLTITGSDSGPVSNACTDNSTCTGLGFSCCLQNQCVRDGAQRPGVNTSDPTFLAAEADVLANPARFILYPQFYFVCSTRPGDSTPPTENPTDPIYEAKIRLLEHEQLFQCLNKVDGEFSYCTVKIEDASAFIPGDFPSVEMATTDDINFANLNTNLSSGIYANNIVKVVYAGKTLYKFNETPLTDVSFVPGTFNDSVDSGKYQKVTVTSALPSGAQDDNLYITYKIDGTCEKIGSTLGRCTKTYIQGASTDQRFTTTWHDSTNLYLLPDYADLSKAVIVKLGGIILPEDSANWTLQSSPKGVRLTTTPFQNQKIEITYFLQDSKVSSVLSAKVKAQEAVNGICNCSGEKCNLKPIYDELNALKRFDCLHEAPSTVEPPANQTVTVSSKNVPHRYFDLNGVNYDEDYSSAPTQEFGDAGVFNYTAGNALKPNNVSAYVGFNEIYGSFLKNGSFARPAKMVRVKKDKYYDLIVSTGSFSSCTSCGTDYYSALQKIFPQSFSIGGGGYAPELFESSRLNNTSPYRSDDLLFGRACFVPATMIPWTHTATDPRLQRQNRLAAQHFLFANGYNRDWFGFDYGSLIGSFDGVNWFSIGSKRRIQAKSGRLFLAVNAFFGDQNIDNNITLNVSETVNFANAFPEADMETDGAQCQRSHFCSTDDDCIKQLGYEYTCQNVSSLSSNWPSFDVNATEAGSDPSFMRRTISSLIAKGTNGQAKRCIYRGRGAPCDQNLTKTDPAQYFNNSVTPGTLTCSPNTICQDLTSAKFNDRIARFASSPVNQNLVEAAGVGNLSDTVGLAARILGRPFDYYGNKSAPSSIRSTLNANGVSAICVPGKNPSSASTTFDLNQRAPATNLDSSDKLYNVGATMSSSSMSAKYYNACPATGVTGSFLHHSNFNLLTSTELSDAAISQNLGTNLLDLSPLRDLGLFSTLSGGQVTTVGYQRNACLRAPGASCFTDLECAPSATIATKVRGADLSALMNPSERKFWEEELVCGNPDFKLVNNGAKNPNYDLKKNRCCREFGKEITVSTQVNDGSGTNDILWCNATTKKPVVAGVNTTLTDRKRYSKVHAVYDKMTCDPSQISSTKTFALSTFNANKYDAMKQILEQYKTLDTLNSRTCCTTHWVRQFAASNGGGTKFSRGKLQTIDKSMFKHVSWFTQNGSLGVTDGPFECDSANFANSSCEVKSFTPAEEERYLTWAASLELIGIPQVAIMTNDEVFKLVDDTQTAVPTGVGVNQPLDNSIKDVNSALNFYDYLETGTNNRYYSAANYDRFNMNAGQLKKVFSEDKFNCCVPSGQQVPDYTNADQCCTGYIGNINNIKRCCLPDFTDLTLYLNRYVSSEGRGLPDSAYDKKTGYIKDPGQVQLLAQQKNLCCSGQVMTGVAISRLSIPIVGGTYMPPDLLSTSRRFNYRSDSVDDNPETGNVGSIFDAGVRWNNHVYCVPAGFGQ